jgi:hypothetical protein
MSHMATLEQKIQAEATVREMIETNGLPEPDQIEYGFTCIRLLWHQPKLVLVVDIDPPPDGADDAEHLVLDLDSDDPKQP